MPLVPGSGLYWRSVLCSKRGMQQTRRMQRMTTRGGHTPSNSHHDNHIYTNNMAYSSTSTSSHSSSSRSGGAAHRAVALDLMLRTFMNSPEFQPYNPRMWEGISKLVPGTTPHQVSSLDPVMRIIIFFLCSVFRGGRSLKLLVDLLRETFQFYQQKGDLLPRHSLILATPTINKSVVPSLCHACVLHSICTFLNLIPSQFHSHTFIHRIQPSLHQSLNCLQSMTPPLLPLVPRLLILDTLMISTGAHSVMGLLEVTLD